jgi:hypothetical protein
MSGVGERPFGVGCAAVEGMRRSSGTFGSKVPAELAHERRVPNEFTKVALHG